MYTGNINKKIFCSGINPVYPCVYREHAHAYTFVAGSPGLSLCIQGTCVKNLNKYKWNAVYPCVYREHDEYVSNRLLSSGLSLCIQGTFNRWWKNQSTKRFIPVYTGNMQGLTINSHKPPVYPCVYREHLATVYWWRKISGLSLCIQGTFSETNQWGCNQRFIPVYTGNIQTSVVKPSWRAVYPCVYREHPRISVFDCSLAGLSLCIQGTSNH